MKTFLLIFFFGSFSIATQAQAKGSVCVEKITTSTEKNIGNPNFNTPVGNKVRIDGKTVSRSSESQTISGLKIKGTHLVKIFQDDKQVHSFRFNFNQFDSPNLCLFVNDFYGTWQLWEMSRKKSCGCK